MRAEGRSGLVVPLRPEIILSSRLSVSLPVCLPKQSNASSRQEEPVVKHLQQVKLARRFSDSVWKLENK